MPAYFRYNDLPKEIQITILEYAFGGYMEHYPACIHQFRPEYHCGCLGGYFVKHADEDGAPTCYPPQGLYRKSRTKCKFNFKEYGISVVLDSRFWKIFVSKDFVENALPVFAANNVVQLRTKLYRVQDRPTDCELVQDTVKGVLLNARDVTILSSLNDTVPPLSLMPLLPASRLQSCHFVMMSQVTWSRRGFSPIRRAPRSLMSIPYLTTTRRLVADQIKDLEIDRRYPEGLLDELKGTKLRTLDWYRSTLLDSLRKCGFSGEGNFHVDIIASTWSSSIYQKPISLVLAADIQTYNLLFVKVRNPYPDVRRGLRPRVPPARPDPR